MLASTIFLSLSFLSGQPEANRGGFWIFLPFTLSLAATAIKLSFWNKERTGNLPRGTRDARLVVIVAILATIADVVFDVGGMTQLNMSMLDPRAIIPPLDRIDPFWVGMLALTVLISLFGELLMLMMLTMGTEIASGMSKQPSKPNQPQKASGSMARDSRKPIGEPETEMIETRDLPPPAPPQHGGLFTDNEYVDADHDQDREMDHSST
ncbi:hypothetical protein H0V99_02130 [Candidatus Saccharibacteria bacterium]|nr:hypothetical protein [Candidatus Saccharibacteria bacterium]